MSSLLEMDSVIKNYGDQQVLTDIYLRCMTGDILGLLGRNGCGKSSLLKILFGTLPADSKFIRINGKVYQYPYKTKNELCYLPQDNFLPNRLIAEKAVELYLGKSQLTTFFDDDILNPLRKNKIAHLSGGELRYLEIKLLLHTQSKFILLDEPFNGVSPILTEEIKKIILAASNTKGIILTDHDYRNVLEIATQTILIHDGGVKRINHKNDLKFWGYIPETD